MVTSAILRQCSSRLASASMLAARPATSARVARTAAGAASSRIAPLHSSSVARAEVVTDKDPQLGDYPELPFENLQRRKYDPGWWDPQEKRNFGETLHEQDDVLGVWAPDVHNISAGTALRRFLIAAAVACTFAGTIYISLPGRPSQPRQYPRDGLLAELGGVPGTAAPVEGAFDKQEGDEEEEEEEEDE